MAELDDDKLRPEDKPIRDRAREARRVGLETVRRRVKERIDETGISMRRLALRAEVSPRTVQRFISEPDRDVHLGNVLAIAEVLLIDARELLDRFPDDER